MAKKIPSLAEIELMLFETYLRDREQYGFFIWDKPGHPVKGFAYREPGSSCGGTLDDDPRETEHQRHERWDAATDLAHWFGGEPPPGYWRRPTDDELKEIMLDPDVQVMLKTGIF